MKFWSTSVYIRTFKHTHTHSCVLAYFVIMTPSKSPDTKPSLPFIETACLQRTIFYCSYPSSLTFFTIFKFFLLTFTDIGWGFSVLGVGLFCCKYSHLTVSFPVCNRGLKKTVYLYSFFIFSVDNIFREEWPIQVT